MLFSMRLKIERYASKIAYFLCQAFVIRLVFPCFYKYTLEELHYWFKHFRATLTRVIVRHFRYHGIQFLTYYGLCYYQVQNRVLTCFLRLNYSAFLTRDVQKLNGWVHLAKYTLKPFLY